MSPATWGGSAPSSVLPAKKNLEGVREGDGDEDPHEVAATERVQGFDRLSDSYKPSESLSLFPLANMIFQASDNSLK